MLIGINVELADSMAATLTTQSESLHDELTRLNGIVDHLLSTWQGGSRATFENEWTPWVQQVNELLSYISELRERLHTTAEGFRLADVF